MRLRTLSVPLWTLGGLLLLLALSRPSFPALAQAGAAAPAASRAARPAAPRPMLRRRLPIRHGLRPKRWVPYRHGFAPVRRASPPPLVVYGRGLPLPRPRAVLRAVVSARVRKPGAIIVPVAPPLPADPAPPAAPPDGAAPAPPAFGPLHTPPSDVPPPAPTVPPDSAPPAPPADSTLPIPAAAAAPRHVPAKPRSAAKRPPPKHARTARDPKSAKPPVAPVGTWINLNADAAGPLGESAWVNLALAGNIRFYRTGKTSFAAVGVGGGSYVSTSDPTEIQILRNYVLSHRARSASPSSPRLLPLP